MGPIHIGDLDDPRLAPYRNLRDSDLSANGGRFMAEGELVVQRLLASPVGAESILVDERRLRSERPLWAPDDVPLYVLPAPAMEEVCGVSFHGGILAVGLRPPPPTLERLVTADGTLVVCPGLDNPANMGGIVRTAAALGAEGLLLGPRCCDPWYRQAVRGSMGAVFRFPIRRAMDLGEDLRWLSRELKVALVATVADGGTELRAAVRPAGQPLALMFGHEHAGLPPELVELCDLRVTVPMHGGTDSLNVVVAAGIVLHHFGHSERRLW